MTTDDPTPEPAGESLAHAMLCAFLTTLATKAAEAVWEQIAPWVGSVGREETVE